MANNNDSLLSRTRQSSAEGSEIIYKGKDLSSLLLMHLDSFHDADRELLLESYEEYGQRYFEKLAQDNKIIPFAAHIFISLDCDKSFWQEKHDLFLLRNNEIKDLLESIFAKMQSFD